MAALDTDIVFAAGFEDLAGSVTARSEPGVFTDIGILFVETGADLAPVVQHGTVHKPLLRFFSQGEMDALPLRVEPSVPIAMRNGQRIVARILDSGLGLPQVQDFPTPRTLRAIGPLLAPDEAALAARAAALVEWHRRSRFCPNCGGRTVPSQRGFARRCTAAECGIEHFPRLDPVVMTLPTSGGWCLLGRQPRFPEGLYSGFAGHVEAGETIEQAARREVFEEAGIVLSDVRYVVSQPWPFPHGLTLGCLGTINERAAGQADGAEIAEVRWFSRAEVSDMVTRTEQAGKLRLPGPISLAHQLARIWLKSCTSATTE